MRVRYQAPLLFLALDAVIAAGGSSQCSSSQCSSWACSATFMDRAETVIRDITKKVAAADCDLARVDQYPAHYDVVAGEQFDFIVVGSGTAGSVVANRLTERSDWTALLLEAGGDPTKTTEVPLYFPFLQRTSLDWRYQTEPSDYNCLGMIDRKCNWPRGKVLGGSSTTNYMLYVRGNAKDYDGWANDGCTGWSYKEVLPYFKKSENMLAKEVTETPDFRKYHGTGGYLQIESWRDEESKPLADIFAKGLKELGYDENPDCNGKSQTGFVTIQGTLEDGRRCSSAKAFLSPAANRNNLKVAKNSFATKILIDEKTNTAYGVEFIDKYGKTVNIKAKKEVIVSAGALNTPQLLMLSGIGPKIVLEEHKIKIIKDLPVGKNLQDHALFIGLVLTINYTKPDESPEDNLFDFLMGRGSRLSGLGLGSHAGFLNTVEGVDFPDIEILFLDFNVNSPGLGFLLDNVNIRSDIKNEYLKINADRYLIFTAVSLLRPHSRGDVKLNSKNPTDNPKLTSGYLTDYRDVETYLRTYDILNKLVKTAALVKLDAKLHEIPVPECSSRFRDATKERRVCTVRHLTTTTYHQCGTCKMGNVWSGDTVLDPRLRVKGVDRLRVVDASAMPNVVSGNINAAVTMIGEKGSDMIKETWNLISLLQL